MERGGKVWMLRADSGGMLRYWIGLWIGVRNLVPPPKPIRVRKEGGEGDGGMGEKGRLDGKGKGKGEKGGERVNDGDMGENVGEKEEEGEEERVNLNVKVDPHLKVDHVLFVVAGIGTDSTWLSSNIKHLQQSISIIFDQIYPDITFNIEIIAIEWRSSLTSLQVHKNLVATAPRAQQLDTNPLREFMTLRVVDYIYYTHPRYRGQILRGITSKLNMAWKEFRRRRPKFGGKVSVFSHSLGSVLMYDLLCKRFHDDQRLLESENMRIDFQVENLFSIGSPLGIFLNLDDTLSLYLKRGSSNEDGDEGKGGLPFKLLNVFHPNDPIATRIEPFVDIRMTEVRPVSVPYWRTMGEHESTVQWLGSMWSGRKNVVEAPASPVDATQSTPALPVAAKEKSEAVMINGNATDRVVAGVTSLEERVAAMQASVAAANQSHHLQSDSKDSVVGGYASAKRQRKIVGNRTRIDYALQVLSAIEEVSTSWSALRAHTDYWSSCDLNLFLVNEMIKTNVGQISEDDPRSVELNAKIVDENIMQKVELAERTKRRQREEEALMNGVIDRASTVEEDDKDTDIQTSLEMMVEKFAEKVIEQSAGMYLLEQSCPGLASSSKGTGVGVDLTNEKGGIDKNAKGEKRSSGSWIGGYLSWFGRSGSQVKESES